MYNVSCTKCLKVHKPKPNYEKQQRLTTGTGI